jgi:hypothetical protein
VPGFPIRDCAASSNNLAPRCPKLNAVDMIAKTIFELLYLVLGLHQFVPRVNCPCAPTPPPFTQILFLDFRANFSPEWPLIVCRHDSPSNLADPRYPRREVKRGRCTILIQELTLITIKNQKQKQIDRGSSWIVKLVFV